MSRITLMTGLWLLAMGAWAQEAIRYTDESVHRISGEVVTVRGNMVTLRKDTGGREAFRIAPDASISVDGRDVRLQDLVPGQQIRVYVTETEEGWVIVAPPPAARTSPISRPEAQSAEPATPRAAPAEAVDDPLPRTAGPLPLIAVAGLGCLALGAGLRLARRRR
jgi:hypothetical protein